MIRETSFLGSMVRKEPWVQKPMPFPPKPSKKKDDEEFERFAEMIRPIFLRMRLTDMLKMNPYAKYMKDIVTNKRKIPEAENFHHSCQLYF